MSTYSQLRRVIPPDQALSNKALQAALQQITNIFRSDLKALSAATAGLENNNGLPAINALTTPIPANVATYFEQTYATGTGVDGTLLLADVIGTCAGWVSNDALSNSVAVLTSMNTAGDLANLTGTSGVFTVMQNAINGAYYNSITGNTVIPGGLPAAGSYTSLDNAFEGATGEGVGLTPAAVSIIQNIQTAYPSQTSQLNTNFANIGAQLNREDINLNLAAIVFANLTPGLQPIGLTLNLPVYGQDTVQGGAAYILQSVANNQSQGGQAVIATMRESRNVRRLASAGITTNTVLSDVVVQPQADLGRGDLTVAQAIGNITY
jgi:hypothetical protein